MAKVRRSSFLRQSPLETVVIGKTEFQFWGLYTPDGIPEEDGDVEHIVTSMDRIDSIAHRYYGDPKLWWVIAEANDLEDPISSLRSGLVLRIPSPRNVLENIAR